METTQDFEDLLSLLEKLNVQYLIIGGLAFIFHAKPRYTKDIDIWVNPEPQNAEKANAALAEFGSPYLITMPLNTDEILQIGLPPDRIDIILNPGALQFRDAWGKRIRSPYGSVETNWIDLDSLITIKKAINDPRHQEDARILMQVRNMKRDR